MKPIREHFVALGVKFVFIVGRSQNRFCPIKVAIETAYGCGYQVVLTEKEYHNERCKLGPTYSNLRAAQIKKFLSDPAVRHTAESLSAESLSTHGHMLDSFVSVLLSPQDRNRQFRQFKHLPKLDP